MLNFEGVDELQPYKTILLYAPQQKTPNCFQSCWLKIKSLLIANGQKIFQKKWKNHKNYQRLVISMLVIIVIKQEL